MKKIKYLFLIVIISFFAYSYNVYANDEITCTYKTAHADDDDDIIFKEIEKNNIERKIVVGIDHLGRFFIIDNLPEIHGAKNDKDGALRYSGEYFFPADPTKFHNASIVETDKIGYEWGNKCFKMFYLYVCDDDIHTAYYSPIIPDTSAPKCAKIEQFGLIEKQTEEPKKEENNGPCVGSDGCKNCKDSNAITECQKSSAYKSWKQNKENYQTCLDQKSHCFKITSQYIGSSTGLEQCLKANNISNAQRKQWENECQASTGYDPSNDPDSPSGGNSGNDPVEDSGNTGVTDNGVTGGDNCSDYFSGKLGDLLSDIFTLVKFAVPILLIGLSVKDFGSAIVNQDGDGLKSATKTLGKRLLIAIMIFLVPTIINLLFDLLGVNSCTAADIIK